MPWNRNPWLVAGGCLSLIASALHIAVIVNGPEWYRFFGAGEEMATMAANGSLVPALVTSGIAAVLMVWAAYAFAGAELIRRLPLMRTALVAISAIYLLRGILIVPVLLQPQSAPFDIWSSLIVLGFGLVYAIGTARAWPRVSSKESIA